MKRRHSTTRNALLILLAATALPPRASAIPLFPEEGISDTSSFDLTGYSGTLSTASAGDLAGTGAISEQGDGAAGMRSTRTPAIAPIQMDDFGNVTLSARFYDASGRVLNCIHWGTDCATFRDDLAVMRSPDSCPSLSRISELVSGLYFLILPDPMYFLVTPADDTVNRSMGLSLAQVIVGLLDWRTAHASQCIPEPDWTQNPTWAGQLAADLLFISAVMVEPRAECSGVRLLVDSLRAGMVLAGNSQEPVRSVLPYAQSAVRSLLDADWNRWARTTNGVAECLVPAIAFTDYAKNASPPQGESAAASSAHIQLIATLVKDITLQFWACYDSLAQSSTTAFEKAVIRDRMMNPGSFATLVNMYRNFRLSNAGDRSYVQNALSSLLMKLDFMGALQVSTILQSGGILDIGAMLTAGWCSAFELGVQALQEALAAENLTPNTRALDTLGANHTTAWTALRDALRQEVRPDRQSLINAIDNLLQLGMPQRAPAQDHLAPPVAPPIRNPDLAPPALPTPSDGTAVAILERPSCAQG